MCNITKHAYERYAEKIKLIPKDEINSMVALNRKLYSDEMNKMYENSYLIYTGQFNNHNKANFRVVDDICLVSDIKDQNIITLYRIDFGMGRKLNKTILEELKKELEEKKEIHNKAVEEVKEKKEEIEEQARQLKDELEEMKKVIKSLEENIKGLEGYKNSISYEEIRSKADYDLIAKKIAYSIHYRKAMEEYTV